MDGSKKGAISSNETIIGYYRTALVKAVRTMLLMKAAMKIGRTLIIGFLATRRDVLEAYFNGLVIGKRLHAKHLFFKDEIGRR